MTFSEEENENKKPTKSALTWVQDFLSRRSHSEKELIEKICKKGFEKNVVQEAIDYAKERKWMESPEELSEKVYKEWNQKNKSHKWIQGYLAEKGLPCDVTKDSQEETRKAAYHLNKKFAIINQDNYKKASSNLASKGFTYEDFKNAKEIINKDT